MIILSKIVVGRGPIYSDLMIIGEAPGAKEEEIGMPFVGRSGKLLDQLLENVGIDSKSGVYFCNVVKCRPPKNRRPTQKEINEGMPWLRQQIYLVNPKFILAAGATAINSILGIKGGISNIRGKWFDWEGRLVMPIFHPSYLLRNPSKIEGKPFSLTQSDLLEVRKKLNLINMSSSMSSLTSI